MKWLNILMMLLIYISGRFERSICISEKESVDIEIEKSEEMENIINGRKEPFIVSIKTHFHKRNIMS
jgi:hypothetical protein